MRLIVLAILVGILHSEPSSASNDSVEQTSERIHGSPLKSLLKKNGTANRRHRVRFESVCTHSELKQQAFSEIQRTNSSLWSLLLRSPGGIARTDCMLFYRVDYNDSERPFYPFRIDHQGRYLKSSIYGIVTVDEEGNFHWHGCDRTRFETYLTKCESEDGPERDYPPVPRVLSCSTTPSPRIVPPRGLPSLPAHGSFSLRGHP